MPIAEKYFEEIRPIFESHWMTNMGPVYKKFQRQLLIIWRCFLSLFVNCDGEIIGITKKVQENQDF